MGKGYAWKRLLAAAAAVVCLVVLLDRVEVRSRLEPVARWIDGLGAWGPIIFILLNLVVGLAPAPGLILTTVALSGVLFGAAWGTLFSFIGCSLAALAGFGIARLYGRRRAQQWLDGHPRLAVLDGALEKDGVRVMMLIRVAIVFPFAVQSYGLGLTRAGWKDFILSLAAMLPGTVFYAVTGAMLGSIAGVVRAESIGPTGWKRVALYFVGALVILILARILSARAEDLLAEYAESEENDAPVAGDVPNDAS